MDDHESPNTEPRTVIRVVGMGQLTVYHVSEDELRMIEIGGPSSTYLNLAILFLSVGASFFASLSMSPPSSIYRFTVMIELTIVSLIAGTVLLVLWRRSSKVASVVIDRIRARGAASATENLIDGTRIEGPNNQ